MCAHKKPARAPPSHVTTPTQHHPDGNLGSPEPGFHLLCGCRITSISIRQQSCRITGAIRHNVGNCPLTQDKAPRCSAHSRCGDCWRCNHRHTHYLACFTCAKCAHPLKFIDAHYRLPDDPFEERYGIPTERCTPCDTEYRRYKRFMAKWDSFSQWADVKAWHMRMITHTYRSSNTEVADATAVLDELMQDHRRMVRNWKSKGWKGSIAVGEVKHRDDGTCHPHLHVATLWDEWPDYSALIANMSGKTDNLDFSKAGQWACRNYLKKYLWKEPQRLGGSESKPRFVMTLGCARKKAPPPLNILDLTPFMETPEWFKVAREVLRKS